LSYFILSFSIVCPHNFLPSHIKFKNINDPNSISILLIGISALFGQIIIGWLSDKYRSFNWLIFGLACCLAGLITCLLPFANDLYFICLYSILYGFLTSVNYVLQSSLVIESLGLANLTIAFGCLQCVQGFSTLLGTPFLGWIKDYSTNYELTFYIGGLLIFLSGSSLLFWPCLSKKN
jgi:MFS transporter, MCT family, solute carrier family 16 (monocarboxylic acid transporters), member 14